MKEHPILFSAPMVRAILAGTKTQTRRVVKFKPHHQIEERDDGSPWPWMYDADRDADHWIPCPYGQPGDRLWLRETFWAWGRWETRFSAKKGRDEWHFVDMTLECGKTYLYPATDKSPQPLRSKRDAGMLPGWWKRPAIHMPRAASRITLEITSVRVERLQDISEVDAQAEGAQWTACGSPQEGSYVAGFAAIWESINGAGSWSDGNPWVWVIAFKHAKGGVA